MGEMFAESNSGSRLFGGQKPAPAKIIFWSIVKNQKIDQTIDFRAPGGFEIVVGVFAARIF